MKSANRLYRAVGSLLLAICLLFGSAGIPNAPASLPVYAKADKEAAQTLTVTDQTKKITRGKTAYVTIKGEPKTKYSIAVYYNSGKSTAKGLESKKTDKNGKLTWRWKVGTRTAPGTYDIVISGGGETLTTTFKVIKR